MFHGRVLVVSDRREIAAELEPIIRREGHLTLLVGTADDAMNVLDDGIVPDVVISDLESQSSLAGLPYLKRFRQLNQAGQHMVVVSRGATFSRTFTSGTGGSSEQAVTLQHPFDEEDVRVTLDRAMGRIRADLENLRGEMFRETVRLQRSIRDAQLQMVQALAITMEAKDPYMHGHCARVAELAVSVARELEIDRDHVDLLRNAALLHEIGKVAVAMELLHKTEALTPDELEQIRAHCLVGGRIVGGVASLESLVPLIETQYTDYVQLPSHIDPTRPEFLLAGILRVVDTYDAMTSDRSYRETLPRDRWEPQLRGGAGTRFHPDAVVALFRVLGDG